MLTAANAVCCTRFLLGVDLYLHMACQFTGSNTDRLSLPTSPSHNGRVVSILRAYSLCLVLTLEFVLLLRLVWTPDRDALHHCAIYCNSTSQFYVRISTIALRPFFVSVVFIMFCSTWVTVFCLIYRRQAGIYRCETVLKEHNKDWDNDHGPLLILYYVLTDLLYFILFILGGAQTLASQLAPNFMQRSFTQVLPTGNRLNFRCLWFVYL